MPEYLVGVDEVGRGCLAGPVVAAAVIFRSEVGLDLFQDSKQLSEIKREHLAKVIREHHWVTLGSASPAEIDKFNILQASFLAMRRAIKALLKILPSGSEIGILVDGHLEIPKLHHPQEPIVQGDQFIPEISAASIVAKVARDQLMKKLSKVHPHYGFEKHKGYGSVTHKKAIKDWGPTLLHRQTFSGVAEWVHLSADRVAQRRTNPKDI